MKGRELSERFFYEYGKPMIESNFKEYEKYMAVGLVGEGSECFGFDDEFSKDHDFGPGFSIWIPESIYEKIGVRLQNEYDKLPKEYMNIKRVGTSYGSHRVGVKTIETFYRQYTGNSKGPRDNMEWMKVPSDFLATATNGKVYFDNYGEFTKIRNELKGFYPKEVIKKKMAAYCALMAQSGQYNYKRCIQRQDYNAAYLACSQFVENVLNAVFLLNNEYKPFYKWTFKKADELRDLREVLDLLKELVSIPDNNVNAMEKVNIIEKICVLIVEDINKKSLTKTSESFLQIQGEHLMESIEDSRLKNMHILTDRIY